MRKKVGKRIVFALLERIRHDITSALYGPRRFTAGFDVRSLRFTRAYRSLVAHKRLYYTSVVFWNAEKK